MRRILIYHAGCADGFCAAWLAHRYQPADTVFIPATHGDPPPDVTGASVLIVDFSYPRETLLKLHSEAQYLIVLDHHKSAQDALAGLPFCRFDMTRSGGRLMWEYLFPDYPISHQPEIPWLVEYTEDRDLWKWSLPSSREINAALRSYPMDFETWDRLHNDGDLATLTSEGAAILRDQAMTVRAKFEQAHVVPCPPVARDLAPIPWMVANATALISETAEALAKETGVGCCWFELASGDRVYSLRTTPVGTETHQDCQSIARLFGGGGHPGAAGFRLPAGSKHPWDLPLEVQ